MFYGIADPLTYILGTIVIVLLPGPNSLYVLSVASQSGVRAGYLGACGIFLGDTILMVLSAMGMASLLKTTPALFMVVKYAGAAYLCWMGINLLHSAWRLARTEGTIAISAPPAPLDPTRPFRTALLISLLNPKAILFFVSFFIQFVDPAYAYPALSFAILGLICQVISALYLSALIVGGARLSRQFQTRRRLSAGVTGSVGALFIGFGAKLANSTLN